ncbi:Uncharacterised protein [Segatella copri]|nr:Uncharacterised protein [Segatella copri]
MLESRFKVLYVNSSAHSQNMHSCILRELLDTTFAKAQTFFLLSNDISSESIFVLSILFKCVWLSL